MRFISLTIFSVHKDCFQCLNSIDQIIIIDFLVDFLNDTEDVIVVLFHF